MLLSLESSLQTFAEFLSSRPVQLETFDKKLFQHLQGLEEESQETPSLRDVYRKRCFDLCAYELDQSNLLRRARYKPLGYAGDFEVLDMLYTMQGKTFWDAFLQRRSSVVVFQQNSSPLLFTRDALFLNPVYRAISNFQPDNLHIIESEPKAISFAKDLFPSAQFYEQLEPSLKNVEFIYAPYLLHCLRDDLVERVLRGLWQRLEPGGTLLLYQLQEHHSLQLFMEWCLDWTLEYHSETRLTNMFQNLGATLKIEKPGEWWRLELNKD